MTVSAKAAYALRTLVAVGATIMFSSHLSGQQYTIKFATLAPEGSTWMNVMKEYDKAIRNESGGRLGFKIYPGAVQGDEKDVLRKTSSPSVSKILEIVFP